MKKKIAWFEGMILTEGEIIRGTKIAGVFEKESHCKSDKADELAVATVVWDSLTKKQQENAKYNSEEISRKFPKFRREPKE